MSAVEKMLEATRPLWIAKARAEGEARGRAEGEAHLFLTTVTALFGEPTDVQKNRIASASPEELERWATRFRSAASIDDVLR